MEHNPATIHKVTEHEADTLPPQNLHAVKAIKFEFVPRDAQRYDTVGDWQLMDDGLLLFTITQYPDNPEYSMAIALHEFIEAVSCIKDGVTTQMVDDFDMGEGVKYDDPGNSINAPYHQQHTVALSLERQFARQLNIDWNTYDKAVIAGPQKGVQNGEVSEGEKAER